MRMTLLVACLWFATSPLWGKIVFYSKQHETTEVHTMDSDGTNQTQLTFNDVSDSFPAWSPNGQQIVFHSTRDGNWEVYVMDADGSNPRNLTRHPANDNYPDWSPDGSRIAFDSARGDGAINLYVMDTDGNNMKQLTHMRIEHWELASKPKWSPDGEWILFERGQIYAIRPDGTELWQVSIPRLNATMFLGGWSPDGKRVLYTEAVNLNINTSFPVIATLAPNGRAEVISWKHVKVPRMPFDSAAFSVDGKSILFSGKKDDAENIYRFGLVDKQLIQLTNNPGTDAAPQEWDSRLLVSPQALTSTHWGEIKTTR